MQTSEMKFSKFLILKLFLIFISSQFFLNTSRAKAADEIKIVYTGLRPGEKLSEKLFYDFEKHTITSHEKIYCCYPNLSERIDELIQAILELAVNEDSNELLIEKLISTVDQLNHSPTLVSGGRQ